MYLIKIKKHNGHNGQYFDLNFQVTEDKHEHFYLMTMYVDMSAFSSDFLIL